jgi:hypothetical protein
MPFTASIPATSIDLLADIRDTFGPRGGVTPNNLHGFTGRDIGIPNAPPLKFGDFTGKGVHPGRERCAKAFLAAAPYNPYSILAYRANGLNVTDIAGGYNWQFVNEPGYFSMSIGGGGGCGYSMDFYSVQHQQYYNTFARLAGGTIGNRALGEVGHATENTVIVMGGNEDGGSVINTVTINSANAPVGAYRTTSQSGGVLGRWYGPTTLKYKDTTQWRTTGGGGGCNGARTFFAGYWPGKWEVSNNLGTSEFTLKPFEFALFGGAVGGDNIGNHPNNGRLFYRNIGAGSPTTSDPFIGAFATLATNWYGGTCTSVFCNWTGAERTFRIFPNHSFQTIHRISFVGDAYTFDLDY